MTIEDPVAQPINCVISIKEINDDGLNRTVILNEEQCTKLEKILEITELEQFECQFNLKPLRKDRFELSGKITANYKQNSAISLDLICVQMAEEFDTELWPISQNDPVKSPELDLEYGDEIIEFYKAGKLDIGQIIYEHFAISIEPFPRSKDEAFEWGSDNELDQAKENPFSALKILKK